MRPKSLSVTWNCISMCPLLSTSFPEESSLARRWSRSLVSPAPLQSPFQLYYARLGVKEPVGSVLVHHRLHSSKRFFISAPSLMSLEIF